MKTIKLRGVRVNNLKGIDLDIPHGQFLAVCGPSGSGKSSLICRTLFAEGQRRYVETFSPYARQFLEQVTRPVAEEMVAVPPAIGWVARKSRYGRRATVASATEFLHHLQLLFTRAAQVMCPECNLPVGKQSPGTIADWLLQAFTQGKLIIGFYPEGADFGDLKTFHARGFVRVVVGQRFEKIESIRTLDSKERPLIVVDRLQLEKMDRQRLLDSLATAFETNQGSLALLVSNFDSNSPADSRGQSVPDAVPELDKRYGFQRRFIEDCDWREYRFFRELICGNCLQRFAAPDPQRLSDSSALGACAQCEGLGSTSEYDWEKIVPDPSLSIAAGAIAPWNSAAYSHERTELMALAADYSLDVHRPFRELTTSARELIWQGVPERKFGGLSGFFQWLEKRRYKTHLRIYAARWKTFRPCSLCQGRRWNEQALVYRLGGSNLAEIHALTAEQAREFLTRLEPLLNTGGSAQLVIRRLLSIIDGMVRLGLGGLELNRPMQQLSVGEQQRLAIARLWNSALVNLLYIFDEPTSGLHPQDSKELIRSLRELCQQSNTVVVADHSPQLIEEADRIVELGPEAGEQGGLIVFDGPLDKLLKSKTSPTSRVLRRALAIDLARTPSRPPTHGPHIRLNGCRGRNLKNIDVSFPRQGFSQVVGVSGSGKVSLVRDTLYAAMARLLGMEGPAPLIFHELAGAEEFESVVLIDDRPLLRNSRSNPVTFVGVFDLIRKLFADTEEARVQNLKPGHFSFNVPGGRCEKCAGEGVLEIDMHFLADLKVNCDECRGNRFRPNILKAKYRSRNILEVLGMTVQDAFLFFRGQRKIQVGLKSLMDCGLGYLRLGQSLATLSQGEEGRLKLAQHLGGGRKGRKLLCLIRPSLGLHGTEIPRLIDCLEGLVATGHTIVAVDNHPVLAGSADWLVEVGPGSGRAGGEILYAGSPMGMASCPTSIFKEWLPPFPTLKQDGRT